MLLALLTSPSFGLLTSARATSLDWVPHLRAAAPLPLPASNSCPVSLSKPTVIGGLDRQIIRRISSIHRRELCQCASRSPRSSSEAVVIAYVVDLSGEVRHAAVSRSTATTAVAECMATAIESWRFPKGHYCSMVNVEQGIELLPHVEIPPGPR